MRITDDPIRDAERWIEEQEKGLPVCDWCNEPIYDIYWYNINGDHVCQRCIDDTKEEIDGY